MTEITTQAPDARAVEAFAERVFGDLAATMTSFSCMLGERLGLFRELARGPATSAELAKRSGASERYVREWASGLASAGYLVYEPSSGRFSLPAEHAAVLADERSPAFAGGAHQVIREMAKLFDPLERAFVDGSGVALASYGDGFWCGVERLTGVAFTHRLVDHWLRAVEGLEARLLNGARVADVGAGVGVAAIEIARAFPRSRVDGFDLVPRNVERAALRARDAGVGDRTSFRVLDAVGEELPGTYDLITLFDVVHDSRDPVTLLRHVRSALAPGGLALVLEIRSEERLEHNAGPLGALLYGFSLFHCMPQSIASGGPGLGACGLPEPKLRALCLEAGFASLTRVAEEPTDLLYAAR
jgi:SAM-dependent methyltransferase